MGVISNLLERRATKQTGGNPASPAYWVQKLFGAGGMDTAAGIAVDEDKALTHTPFWAAVNIISGAIGAMPLITYKRLQPRGKERAFEHSNYSLLHDDANPFMSAQILRETLMGHVLTGGNGYAEIQRDGAGRAVSLWPLLPDRTTPKVITFQGERTVVYETQAIADGQQGRKVQIPWSDVLHIPGLGFDGLKGYSVVEYHKESIALGMGVKKYGAKFFGNGAKPGGVLEHPGKLNEEQLKQLREDWNAKHEGLDNAERTAILTGGMKFHATGIEPEKAQALETQKFAVNDVARMFQIPPHMLADLDRATFSNIEQQAIEFLTLTLDKWLVKWENECRRKLFSTRDKLYFPQFLREALLRGDTLNRYRAYAIGKTSGFLSTNDIHDAENMNPIEGGDVYLDPMNMKPAGSEAMRTLLQDTWQRLIRREVGALRKAAGKDGFAEFVGDFYGKHQRHICSMLSPVLGVARGLAEGERLAAVESRRYVEEQSRRLLGTEAVEQVLREMEETFAGRLTERMLKGTNHDAL